jgi:NAD(P)-dependent dehydrogenase (short-subunit alcohol dehydrogenase family)
MNPVYLITGAGHFPGIGSEVAVQLLTGGKNVAVNSRQFDESWSNLLQLYPDNLILFAADITDPAQQKEFIQQAVTRWGRIDGLVNNASPTTTGVYDNGILNRSSWQDNFILNVIRTMSKKHIETPYSKVKKKNLASR